MLLGSECLNAWEEDNNPISCYATDATCSDVISQIPHSESVDHDKKKIFNYFVDCQTNSTVRDNPEEKNLSRQGQGVTWINNFFGELKELKKLPDNWNGLGSESPNSMAHYNAEKILFAMYDAGFQPQKISPSAEDGIAITLFEGDKYVILEAYNNGEIVMGFSKNGKYTILEIADTEYEMKDAIEEVELFLNA